MTPVSPRLSSQLFAAELASYQLPSEAGCQEVWDQDPNINREIANFPDSPLLEPCGEMSRNS